MRIFDTGGFLARASERASERTKRVFAHEYVWHILFSMRLVLGTVGKKGDAGTRWGVENDGVAVVKGNVQLVDPPTPRSGTPLVTHVDMNMFVGWRRAGHGCSGVWAVSTGGLSSKSSSSPSKLLGGERN